MGRIFRWMKAVPCVPRLKQRSIVLLTHGMADIDGMDWVLMRARIDMILLRSQTQQASS